MALPQTGWLGYRGVQENEEAREKSGPLEGEGAGKQGKGPSTPGPCSHRMPLVSTWRECAVCLL